MNWTLNNGAVITIPIWQKEWGVQSFMNDFNTDISELMTYVDDVPTFFMGVLSDYTTEYEPTAMLSGVGVPANKIFVCNDNQYNPQYCSSMSATRFTIGGEDEPKEFYFGDNGSMNGWIGEPSENRLAIGFADVIYHYFYAIKDEESFKRGEIVKVHVYVSNGYYGINPGYRIASEEFIDASILSSNNGAYGLWALTHDVEADIPTDDPYEEYPPEGGYGGKPNPTSEGEILGIPNLPTIDTSGGTMLYCVSPTNLRAVHQQLWSRDIFDAILKVNESVMSNIIDCYTLPNVEEGSSGTISIGNTTINTTCDHVVKSWSSINFGKLKIKNKYSSYLDYPPYTSIDLILPYYGTVALDVDYIMSKELGVVYHYNLFSGDAVIFLTANDSVFAMFNCNVKNSIPLSMSTNAGFVRAGLGLCSAVGNFSSKNYVGAISDTMESFKDAKPEFATSGSFSGGFGLMGMQSPMIMRKYPNKVSPTNQNKIDGYPNFATFKIKNLSGLTRVDSINLSGMSATESEKMEIESILKEGVIL